MKIAATDGNRSRKYPFITGEVFANESPTVRLNETAELNSSDPTSSHWFMSCGAICCCSAIGTEQLPSSLRTTWPRWMSSTSWSYAA